MTWTLIILLILIGLFLVILEIVAIPGTTVAGVLGVLIIIFAIWESYISKGIIAGNITLAVTILFLFVSLYYALKSKTWKKLQLNTAIDSKIDNIKDKVKVNDEGITVSRLAPSGKALINGEYFEVHTLSAFIDPNTSIVVIKIENNKIIVQPKNV
jgi:membrane-bound ClpP family serine protease